jgi:2-iminobutanoate/2-iminopropanoate deaminase
MKRETLYTEAAPDPKGPYAQAVVAEGRTVYVAGQGPVDPVSGEFRFGSFQEQAELVFRNVGTILEAAGSGWAHVLQVRVFLANLDHASEMNEIYKQFFPEPRPARTTVGAGLPGDMAIEVDCVALVPET